MNFPPQVRGQFIGKAAEFSASLTDEVLLLLAAVVVIYIVLGVLYESYIHPITIISTLPPAGVGALLALMVCGMSLSVDGIVGIVLLIGIVKKNAIMMIDFAHRRAARRHEPARCDPPRVPAALPADHDDDGRRAARRVAAGARQRHRIGAAQAARRFDRRRIAAVAADYAVYDAGDLSVLRAVVGLGEGAACAAGGVAGACGVSVCDVRVVAGLPSPYPLPQAGEGKNAHSSANARARSPSPACGRGPG